MIFEIDVEVYKSIKGLVSGMGECALLRSQLVGSRFQRLSAIGCGQIGSKE